MRMFDISNELLETLLFDDSSNLLSSLFVKQTYRKPDAINYLKIETPLGNLWLIDAHVSSRLVVRYRGYKFYITLGYGYENIYLTLCSMTYQEALSLTEDYFKSLQSWIFSNRNKSVSKKGLSILDRNYSSCIYNHYTHEVLVV